MMKFYGTMVCKDCLEAREHLNAAGVLFDYVDISVSTGNMKEFLRLRDTRKEFDDVKKHGSIGIPCFLKDDGTVIIGASQLLKEARG